MDKPQIVIVEDDAIISELLAYNLESAGYATVRFADGQGLLERLEKTGSISLFILDIMLPGMDGYELCARIRKIPRLDMVPILMLTARGAESDKVKGLETGADDYLTKPFGMRELLARVQALIRRYRKSILSELNESVQELTGEDHQNQDRISFQGLVVDDRRHRVYKDDTEIEMTNREYELLKFLMLHPGVAYSRDDLLNQVWGYDYSGETRTVDVHIRQLRRKIEEDDANPVFIETVRGRGYRFTDRFQL